MMIGKTYKLEYLSDKQLVLAINRGEHSLFNTLFLRHRSRLYRYIYSLTGDPHLADDVVQDALIKAYKNLAQFRNNATFKTWLFTIARNTWKNHLRTQSRQRIDESKNIHDMDIADDLSVEDQLTKHQQVSILHKSIQFLPTRQRQALSLRIESDLSVREIALEMGCTENTVKATYHHGMKSIEQRLAA